MTSMARPAGSPIGSSSQLPPRPPAPAARSAYDNPYRGPQQNIASAFEVPGRQPRPSYTPAPKSSAPKTQSTPYQAYAQPGQAQSIPTQSQGTPYQAYSQPSKPALRPASQTVTGDWQGSYAAAPASQRPPPFQMGTAQTPWGQSMDPFAERDAFVNQLNQQRMQNQIAFNSGGPTDPTAGMTPGLDYQKAMQQAGLGDGAPSMAADYGDSMISRLNQAFGGQGDPFTFANQQQPVTPYQPYVNQQGQQFQDTMSFAPGTSQAYQNQAYGNYANQQGYYQPQQPATPQQGFLASLAQIQQQQAMQDRGPGRAVGNPDGTVSWVPDRPVAPYTYSPVSTVGPPPQAPTGPANPYGPPVTDRPAPRPYTPPRTGIDANRSQFLQNKAAGRYENPAATYDDYVKSGLDDAVGKVLNSPAGAEMYNQYQSADPKNKKAIGDRLKNLVYASASQQGVSPADDWMSKKTGKPAPEGKDQYFNDAMARHQTKQSGLAAKGRYQDAMDDKYLRNRYGYGEDRAGFRQAMTDYESGKAQSIQPQSRGMPYEYEPSLPPGTTAADMQQRYKDRNAAPVNAPQVRPPAFTNRPWQVRQ